MDTVNIFRLLNLKFIPVKQKKKHQKKTLFLSSVFNVRVFVLLFLQVSDYGMQQCRSTVVNVSAKPKLRLDPPSATVYRGDSVRIRCLSSDIDQSNGYSWTKNNALFQSDAETELWEDLYPDGSILKINNIQVIYIHYKFIRLVFTPVSQ